jgi:lysophospholipase L1-like esterase
MRFHRTLIPLLAAASVAACVHRGASASGQWVATWQAAPQLTEQRNMPPVPLAAHTIRQNVRLTLGGARLRVRFSNEFGDGPLTIGAARIDRSGARDTIGDATPTPITFRGIASVTIPAGEAVVSDVIELSARPLSDFAITLFLPSVPSGVTGHPGSRTTSFIVDGDHTRDAAFVNPTTTEHWYVISRIDVERPAPSAAIVVLGNSIADGRGSGTDKNDRWPDNLARRLHDNSATLNVAVLNAGIGGNTILRGGLGPTALSRFTRDVLVQPSARWLLISEGVNDIGGARGGDSSAAVARELIDAYKLMIDRAHARGFKVYGATILPFNGSQYGSSDHEAARTTVNRWIRESHAFDAVVDFDAVMRDSADPTRLRRDVDSGDHLHPNEHGYEVMGQAIDLRLFVASS